MSKFLTLSKNPLGKKDPFSLCEGKKVLLLDISSSMNSPLESGETRYEALLGVLKSFPSTDRICFSSGASFHFPSEEIPLPNGSTYICDALHEAHQRGYDGVVIVSDGEIFDKDKALPLLRLFTSVKGVFIGAEGDTHGKASLQALCKDGFAEGSMEDTKLIEKTIAGFLGKGK
jgi:hypothetical protein